MAHRPLTLIVPTRPPHRPLDAPLGQGLLLAHAADGLATGILLFDGAANVIASNAAARRLLLGSPEVRLVALPDAPNGRGRLSLADAATESLLDASVRACARRWAEADRLQPDADSGPPAFALSRLDGRPRLSLRLSAVPPTVVPSDRIARMPTVLGQLVDHQRVVGPHPRLLHDLFDLGDAAARVAVACLRAESVKDVARSLGISVNTVKSHLLTVYVKTGCTRRSQLVRLLAQLGEPQPPGHGGPPPS